MKSEHLGKATIEPDGVFPVSTTGTWTLRYTVGKYGIDDGGGIIVIQRPMADAEQLQCDRPYDNGYVTARTDGDASLRVSFQKRYWIRPCKDAIVVGVYDGSLSKGDEIFITIGDRGEGGGGWAVQTFPETSHTFHVLVDAFGTREYYPVAESPTIRIVPGLPANIDAVVPSRCRPGEAVSLKIRVTDAWHNPLDEFTGLVNVRTGQWEKSFSLSRGVQEVGEIVLDGEGIHRLELTCEEKKLSGQSNPILVSNEPVNMFWADMHGQTEATVGTGSVEEYFAFARDKALIDICAWQGNDFQVTDELWREVCRETKAFNESGKFVAFLGYEWSGLTPAGGDHNVLYLKDDQPIHRCSHWQIHDGSSDDDDCYPLSALWETFGERNDVMAIAHVGGRYANLDFWSEKFSGLIEVHSHHGTFEWLMREAIDRGLVFGVVGQSDDHSGRVGLSGPLRPLSRDFVTFDVFGGMTGIYCERLDRDTIWQALGARHCYATSGARMLLDVRCKNAIMGDIISSGEPMEITALAAGTKPLLDLELYRDCEAIYRHKLVENSADNWVRIEWSGVRVRSRNKIADWPITIKIGGATIGEYQPYGFRQNDENVTQTAPSELKIESRTSGDIRGVFIKLSDRNATIDFESPHVQKNIPVTGLTDEPMSVNAGGVNLAVRFSIQPPEPRPMESSFTVCDDTPTSARHAYWVKAVQMDGHTAWSSPIFLKK